jgi:hypothetical protein
MNTTQAGNVAEYVAKSYFLKKDYEVYSGCPGNRFDFIVVDPSGVKKTVEVKSTGYLRPDMDNMYQVKIHRSYSGDAFDNSSVDFLCVYITPLDKLLVLDTKDFSNKKQMNFTEEFIMNFPS